MHILDNPVEALSLVISLYALFCSAVYWFRFREYTILPKSDTVCKITVSNVISLPHGNQWNSPCSSRETHCLISEIYWSTVKFSGQPVSFFSGISYISLILCGRLITFETVVLHCFGFSELIKISAYTLRNQ